MEYAVADKEYIDQRAKCLSDILKDISNQRSLDEIMEAYTASRKYVHEVWKNQTHRYVSAEERLNHILAALSVELTNDLKRVLKKLEEILVTDPPSLIEGVKETLGTLSLKYKMGIICDTGITPSRVLRKILAGHGVLGFLRPLSSQTKSATKPHKIIFEIALRNLGTKPSETIHIGDIPETDIAGAKAIGMKTIWFNNKGTPVNSPYKPDCEIERFPDIMKILDSLR